MTVEAPPPVAAQRFESLDALRGICALLVALHHFSTPGLISTSGLIRNSHVFVDYFFVLSGFVIAFSYGDRLEQRQISVRRFMALRLGRIYPLHIAILAMLVAIELALYFAGTMSGVGSREVFVGQRSPYSLTLNVLLLQSFGLENELSWNGPSWSIAAEMWTYLLFGFVVLAPRKMVPWLIGALSLSSLALLLAHKTSINATYDLGFARCVFGFGIGFGLYRVFRRAGPKGGSRAELASVVAVILFVWLARGRWTFAAPLVFAIGIYVLAGGRGVLSITLSSGPFQLLGLLSYSIYMIHLFVMARMVQALHWIAPQFTKWDGGTWVLAGPPFFGDLLTIPYLATVVGCSYASFRLIEKPGRELTRSWLNRRKISRQVTAAE